MHLAQELLINIQYSGSSRSFPKERLEDEECRGQPLEVDNDQLKLILLQLHKKLPKNSKSTILQLFGIWSKLEGCKSSISRCLVSWAKVKNIIILKCQLVAQMVKNLTATQETRIWSLGQENPLEKGMATHSSILAWRISWTEAPGGLSPWVHKEADTTEWLSLWYYILGEQQNSPLG